MNSLNKSLVLITGLGIFLVACSSSPPRISVPDTPVEVKDEEIKNSVAQPIEVEPLNNQPSIAPVKNNTTKDSASASVWQNLIYQADEHKQQGNLDKAIIKLEQAQRIAPNEPSIYSRLAALSFSQGNPEQAEAFSLKGLSVSKLANAVTEYTRYFWHIIAYSRQLLGDTKGYQQALEKMNQGQ